MDYTNPDMQLFGVIAVISALIIFLVVMFLIIPCANKERYRVFNNRKKCDHSKFSIIHQNKEPNANFENEYKINSIELPASHGHPCACYNWCSKNGNCEGFRYVNNIRKGIDRCDFMGKEITESDLRAQKNTTYFQKI